MAVPTRPERALKPHKKARTLQLRAIKATAIARVAKRRLTPIRHLRARISHRTAAIGEPS